MFTEEDILRASHIIMGMDRSYSIDESKSRSMAQNILESLFIRYDLMFGVDAMLEYDDYNAVSVGQAKETVKRIQKEFFMMKEEAY